MNDFSSMAGMMPVMMMPSWITMILSKLPKEQRIDFAENMVANIVEKGSEGLTDEEKKEFIEKLIIKIKPKVNI